MSVTSFSRYLFVLSLLAIATNLQAQVSVELPAFGISVKTDASSATANGNEAGVMSDVEMEGVAVINGEVYIDGEKVPANLSTYKSKKSGKSYLIKRDRHGNVSVTEK